MKNSLGTTIPSWFYYNLKSIDSNFKLVYHDFKLLWDDTMNEYTGALDDPRFNIHKEFGKELWGFPLKDKEGSPIPENKWHIWHKFNSGFTHVLKIESLGGEYLNIVLDRLYLQANFKNKNKAVAWNKRLRQDQEYAQTKAQDDTKEMFDAVQDENKWLVRRAMENFERGITAPTNPQKETISSYSNQKHRSRLTRPLEDEDVGLVGFKK